MTQASQDMEIFPHGVTFGVGPERQIEISQLKRKKLAWKSWSFGLPVAGRWVDNGDC